MSDYDDVIQRLEDEGLTEEAEVLKRYAATSLRQQASKAPVLEEENAALQARIKALEDGPKREAALKAAYVDVGALSASEREIINSQQAETYDEEWARNLVGKYGLPVTTKEEPVFMPAAAGMVEAATSPGAKVTDKTALTPQEVASWPEQKRLAFAERDDANKTGYMAALLRGETLSGVDFD